MDIISREDWGARKPAGDFVVQDTPAEAYLHHSVGYGSGGAQYMRDMQAFHQSKGWKDIAYNFVVDGRTLEVFEGRGGNIVPGAQKGHNRGTVAICVMGDYRREPVTELLLDTIAELVDYLHKRGWGPQYLTGGHRDAPGQTTTCPGDLGDYIGAINERIDVDYRGVKNVPDEEWARRVVDYGIDSGLIVVGDNTVDDWEDDRFTMGRLWTLFYRQR